jgi:hypothetical protein
MAKACWSVQPRAAMRMPLACSITAREASACCICTARSRCWKKDAATCIAMPACAASSSPSATSSALKPSVCREYTLSAPTTLPSEDIGSDTMLRAPSRAARST